MPGFLDVTREQIKTADVASRLQAGDIVVLRQSPELLAYRNLLIEHAAGPDGKHRVEIEALFHQKRVPSDEVIADVSRTFARLSTDYVLTVMLRDLYRDCRLPGPLLVDYGGLRLVLPPAAWERLRSRKDLLTEEDWNGPKNDPAWYGVLMTAPARMHRDIGGPHFTLQVNFWCALQDLSAKESLLFFPEAFRDGRSDAFYLPLNGEDPSEWGYGKPLSFDLKAGDIIIFYGEHYHCSPVYRSDTVRISQDIRVVSRGYDDNGWYRGGFVSFNDFMPSTEEPAGDLGAAARARALHHLKAAPESPLAWAESNPTQALAIQPMQWLSKPRDQAFIKEAVAAMERMPFAEDRFLDPYFALDTSDTATRERIERHVIERTQSFYWACVFGGLALEGGRQALADQAFARAQTLASATQLSCAHNPLDYFVANAKPGSSRGAFLSAMSPDDVPEIVRLYRAGAVGAVGTSAQTMFRPRFPFVLDQPKPTKQGIGGLLDGIAARFSPKPAFPARKLQVNPSPQHK